MSLPHVDAAALHLGAWGGWGADVRDDLQPLFARLLRIAPVHEVTMADGHPAYLVLGHAAARQALNDPRISKDMQAALSGDPGVVAEGLPGPAFSRHMLNVDPPDHTRLRRLVAPAFSAARVAALEGPIQAIADSLLDDLSPLPTRTPAARRALVDGLAWGDLSDTDTDAGTDTDTDTAAGDEPVVDLVAGYARPLPFQVIGELLGVPAADRPDLQGWFATLLSPWSSPPPDEVVEASDSIVAYLDDLVAAKRFRPGDDLVSELVAASVDGDRLTHQELLSTLFQLVVAGHDTTTSLIGNAVVALLDHPDQLRLLADDPALVPAAIEELLRFAAPVPHATFRYATEDLEIDGVPVRAGHQVLVCLAGANHDPELVGHPHVLDLTRSAKATGPVPPTGPARLDGPTCPALPAVDRPAGQTAPPEPAQPTGPARPGAAARAEPVSAAGPDRTGRPRHLAFGHGIHFCLGAGLARLEARVALATLLARHPAVRLSGPRSELRWAHGDGLVLRGLTHLPVILEPRSPQ